MNIAEQNRCEMHTVGSLMLTTSENDKWHNDSSIPKEWKNTGATQGYKYIWSYFNNIAVVCGSPMGKGSALKNRFAFCKGVHQR